MLVSFCKRIFFLLLIIHPPLFANEDFIQLDRHADPSSYIHGCVNAITGSLIFSTPDITIDGPEPFSFARNYCSGNRSKRNIGIGFTHNHPTKMYRLSSHTSYKNLSIEDVNGDRIKFTARGKNNTFYFNPSQLKCGFTNCGGGEITGRTNSKNILINRNKKDKKGSKNEKCIAQLSDGTQRFYAIDSHMTHEIRPSGNQIQYSYDKDNRIKRIAATDSTGNIEFGWMNFSYQSNNKKIHVTASNGKEATYYLSEYNKYQDSKEKKVYQLDGYSTHAIPYCSYDYKKIYPESTNQKFWYLDQLTWLDGNTVKFKYCDNKVTEILIPLSVKDDISIYKIHYHSFKDRTTVRDCEGGKTEYHYSSKKRLKSKKRYERLKNGNSRPYSEQKFYWGKRARKNKAGTPINGNEGNLITKGITNAKHQLLSAMNYTYDSHGNVLEETIVGHLTGYQQPTPISLDKSYRPILNDQESYQRHYQYTNDGFNLVSSMTEDDGTQVLWSYLPNTDRPIKKLICCLEEICEREFYEYNPLRILTKKIKDNGTSSDPSNLSNVTERLITEIEPNMSPGTPGFGKPLRITESYWDPDSKQEILLRRVDYTYGIYDLVTSESHYDANDILCFTLTYQYDTMGNCIEETDPIGRKTLSQYNSTHQCIYRELIGSGCSHHFTYDRRGRLTQKEETHQSGERFVTSYQYDHLDRKTAEIDPYGQKTSYRYDNMGRLIQTSYPPVINEKDSLITPTESYKYNIWDQVITEKDPSGNMIQRSYTLHGKVTEECYPDGTKELFRYNLNGTLKKVVHKNGSYTQYTYDSQRRVLCEQTFNHDDVLLREKHFQYERNHLACEIDPMGNRTEYNYDGAGRIIRKIQQGNGITHREEYVYDALGRQHGILTWYGEEEDNFTRVIKEYDFLNRVIEERIEDSSGDCFSRKTYAYDTPGNCIETVIYQSDDLNSTHRTEYTSYNLPIKSIDPLSHETHYSYDFHHKNAFNQKVLKTIVTDPNGIQTISIKDTHGRDVHVQKVNSQGVLLSSERMTYDIQGCKVLHSSDVIVDGNIVREYQVKFSYDSMKRLITIVEDPAQKKKTTHLTYTDTGMVQTKTKPNGVVITYQYDELGREIHKESSDGTVIYDFTYDNNNNLLLSIDRVNQSILQREYDPFNNLASEILPNGEKVSFAYDGFKRVTRFNLPDGSWVDYNYGPIDMLSVSRFSPEGEMQYQHRYLETDWCGKSLKSKLITNDRATFEWDCLGRITKIESPHFSETIPLGGYDPVGNLLFVNTTGIWGTDQETYQYDDLNQLVKEKGVQSHSYQQDSLQNRLSKDQHQHTVNSLNQIEKDNRHTYFYDTNGNLISQSGSESPLSYQYDALDRLISVIKEQEWRIDSAYDSLGRCISTKKYHWQNGWEEKETSHYIFQGLTEVGCISPKGEFLQLRIIGKKDGISIRTAIAIELDGEVYSPIYDHRCNVVSLIEKKSNKIVEAYRYTSFGDSAIYDSTGTLMGASLVDNPWRFGNQRYNSQTDLYNFGKRYYRPSLGRWLSPDPGDFVDGLNLYAYVHNRPMTFTDFYGFASEEFRRPKLMACAGGGGAAHPLSDSACRTLGKVIEIAGHHLIPSSQLQYGVEGIGRACAGESFQHQKSWESGTVSNVVGDKPFSNALVRYIPGILTSDPSAERAATKISGMLGGHQVAYTCEVERGLTSDIGVCCQRYLHLPSSSIDNVRETVLNDYHEMKEKCGENFSLYYLPYSRGGLNFYEATHDLPEECRMKMNVNTLGSAKLIPNGLYNSAENYTNNWDMVHYISRIVSDTQNSTIINTGYSSGSLLSPINDHFIDSQGYEDVLNKICEKILDKELMRWE